MSQAGHVIDLRSALEYLKTIPGQYLETDVLSMSSPVYTAAWARAAPYAVPLRRAPPWCSPM